MPMVKLFASLPEAKKVIADRKAVRATFEGRAYSIARLGDKLFASADICPHLGASLSGGIVNRFGEIVCPLHTYRYNLQHGAECESRTRDLSIYPVIIREDGIFLETAP